MERWLFDTFVGLADCRPRMLNVHLWVSEMSFSQIIITFVVMKNIVLSLLASLGLCANCTAQDAVKVLSPKAFLAAAQSDTTALLLDVRQPSEFAEGHLPQAVNLDWLNREAFAIGMKRLDMSRTYYVYCRSGRRSHEAAVCLLQAGYRVVDMKGGILLWKEQGLPVVTDKTL